MYWCPLLNIRGRTGLNKRGVAGVRGPSDNLNISEREGVPDKRGNDNCSRSKVATFYH